ncbi:unnamed protein product, partial [Amoebophrya sp. A25]
GQQATNAAGFAVAGEVEEKGGAGTTGKVSGGHHLHQLYRFASPLNKARTPHHHRKMELIEEQNEVHQEPRLHEEPLDNKESSRPATVYQHEPFASTHHVLGTAPTQEFFPGAPPPAPDVGPISNMLRGSCRGFSVPSRSPGSLSRLLAFHGRLGGLTVMRLLR